MFDIKGISGGVFVTLDYAVGLIMLLWNQEGNTVVKVKPEVPCLPWRTTIISRLTGYFLFWIRSHDVTKSRIIEFWESIYFWAANRWLWGNNLFSTSDWLLKITLTHNLNWGVGLVTPSGNLKYILKTLLIPIYTLLPSIIFLIAVNVKGSSIFLTDVAFWKWTFTGALNRKLRSIIRSIGVCFYNDQNWIFEL